jgi:hypothetical protein
MLQPFDPVSLVLVALLNPAVVVVAFLMGRAADQRAKVVVAGFVAAIAGAAFLWLATFLKLVPARGLGGEAGAFMASFLFGVVWAAVGYATRRRA